MRDFVKIEDAVKSLEEYLGKENVKKINSKKYALNSRLMLIENFDNLTIYLVEIDDKLYFSDFGFVKESFSNLKLKKEEMEGFYNYLNKSHIEFEDNERFLMQTNQNRVYLDYNLFIIAISYLQAFSIE